MCIYKIYTFVYTNICKYFASKDEALKYDIFYCIYSHIITIVSQKKKILFLRP